MAELQDFKCPSCGGAIHFDTGVQKMKCPYCDAEFDIDSLKALENEPEILDEDKFAWDNTPGQEWSEEDQEQLNSYVCNSCGGEIIGDKTLGATSCPYCGSPVVMTKMFAGILKPDYVIPFKYDKKQAEDSLRKYVKSKRFVPKLFRSENRIKEIRGIYVPFWLFDSKIDADIQYNATEVTTWSDSEYVYTKTDHYKLYRSGDMKFQHIPVDGSSKMPDDLMESIEPFDFSEAVDFQTAYLSGFFANRYDVTADDSVERANTRIKNGTEAEFKKTTKGYDSVVTAASSMRLSESTEHYALYPVWILNTKWNGNDYMFAMNGQTGKFTGNLPASVGGLWGWFFIITGIIGILLFLLFYFVF